MHAAAMIIPSDGEKKYCCMQDYLFPNVIIFLLALVEIPGGETDTEYAVIGCFVNVAALRNPLHNNSAITDATTITFNRWLLEYDEQKQWIIIRPYKSQNTFHMQKSQQQKYCICNISSFEHGDFLPKLSTTRNVWYGRELN